MGLSSEQGYSKLAFVKEYEVGSLEHRNKNSRNSDGMWIVAYYKECLKKLLT